MNFHDNKSTILPPLAALDTPPHPQPPHTPSPTPRPPFFTNPVEHGGRKIFHSEILSSMHASSSSLFLSLLLLLALPCLAFPSPAALSRQFPVNCPRARRGGAGKGREREKGHISHSGFMYGIYKRSDGVFLPGPAIDRRAGAGYGVLVLISPFFSLCCVQHMEREGHTHHRHLEMQKERKGGRREEGEKGGQKTFWVSSPTPKQNRTERNRTLVFGFRMVRGGGR